MASEDVTDLVRRDSLHFLASDTATFVDPDLRSSGGFSEQLSQLREDRVYTDLTLDTSGVQVHCHAVILAASSPYFKRRLQPPTLTLQMDEVEPEVLLAIVNYIYTTEIEVSTTNVEAVSIASGLFELDGLTSFCDGFLSDHMVPANCLGMRMHAEKINLPKTLKAARFCMLSSLFDIVQRARESEYRILTKQAMIEYISSDDIQVDNENTVFEFVVKWIRADLSSREGLAEEVMSLVHFTSCTPDFLCDVVDHSQYVTSPKIQQLIRDAKNHLLLARKDDCPTRMRRNRKQLLIIGGCLKGDSVNQDCYVYDDTSNTWQEFAKLPGDKLFHVRACLLGNKVILTGGSSSYTLNVFTGRGIKRQAWQLELKSGEWQQLPDMLEARANHALASAADDVYVIGGCVRNAGWHTNTAECLSTGAEAWTPIPPMQASLGDHMAVTVGGTSIFVLGGTFNQKSSKLTLEYVTTAGEWLQRAEMPAACDYGSAAVLHHTIYVVGGGTLMAYSVKHDSWAVLMEPRVATQLPAAAGWRGKVVVGGGRRDWKSGSHCSDIEVYSAESNHWGAWLTPLPCELADHCMMEVTCITDLQDV